MQWTSIYFMYGVNITVSKVVYIIGYYLGNKHYLIMFMYTVITTLHHVWVKILHFMYTVNITVLLSVTSIILNGSPKFFIVNGFYCSILYSMNWLYLFVLDKLTLLILLKELSVLRVLVRYYHNQNIPWYLHYCFTWAILYYDVGNFAVNKDIKYTLHDNL